MASNQRATCLFASNTPRLFIVDLFPLLHADGTFRIEEGGVLLPHRLWDEAGEAYGPIDGPRTQREPPTKRNLRAMASNLRAIQIHSRPLQDSFPSFTKKRHL